MSFHPDENIETESDFIPLLDEMPNSFMERMMTAKR